MPAGRLSCRRYSTPLRPWHVSTEPAGWRKHPMVEVRASDLSSPVIRNRDRDEKDGAMKKRIEGQLLVAAEPQRLFRALTTAQELTQWFCEYAEVALVERRYDFWGRFTPEAPEQDRGRHRLLVLEPNQRLSFAWQLGEAETIVDVHLQAQNE